MTLYGYYSKTQQEHNKKYYIYDSPQKKELIVTEVTEVRYSKDYPNKGFTDITYIGEVTNFIKVVSVPYNF